MSIVQAIGGGCLIREGLNLPYLQVKVSMRLGDTLRQLFFARSRTQLSWFHSTVQVVAGFLLYLADLAMGDDALILNRGGALLVALHEVEEPHFG